MVFIYKNIQRLDSIIDSARAGKGSILYFDIFDSIRDISFVFDNYLHIRNRGMHYLIMIFTTGRRKMQKY
jgi:hypothetical protein